MPYADPEKRRACARAWAAGHYAAHREEARALDRAWYAAHRAKTLTRRRLYNATHREERAAYTAAYWLAHPAEKREHNRRRREAPFTYSRLDPWSDTCAICGEDLVLSHPYPDPQSVTEGHEPPIAWMSQHPEYAGPLVLRPEHWGCNAAKGDRPDWEAVGYSSFTGLR